MTPTRTLLASCALAALAPAALAQSSVTVYGLLDAAVVQGKGAATGVKAIDASDRRVDAGGMSTSHIGLRGSEDLGGGWSAEFDLSSFIRNATGASGRNDAIGAPVNVAADPFWSRAAWVGIGNASLGRLRVGNLTTPLFVNSITSNAFGDSTVFSPLNLVTHIGGPQAGGTGWSSSVVYDSPLMAGVGLSLAVTDANASGRNLGARLGWRSGPAAASLAWQSVKRNPVSFADGTTANNVSTWVLGGSYAFSALTVYAHLGRLQNDGTEAAPQSVSYRLTELSAAMPLGNGRVLAGWALRKTSDTPSPVPATAAGGNVKRSVMTLGYDHTLSKRTDVYAMLLRDQTDTRTLGAPPRIVAASGSTLGLGIRHRF